MMSFWGELLRGTAARDDLISGAALYFDQSGYISLFVCI